MAGAAGDFGAVLRRRRTEASLTQEQLAERTGLSVRTIRDLERGRVRYPRPGSLRLLADVLDLGGAQLGEFEALGRQHYWTERVAEVRMAATDGHAGAAPNPVPADRPVPAQLPADVAGFTGRSEDMRELDALLADGDPGAVPITVLAGAPGVGKSALAVHWAHRVRHRFPDGQLYLNLMGHAAAPPLSPAEALTRLLRSLDVAPDRVPTDVTDAAALFRSLLADTRTLLVLDDAGQADQVRPLLPGGPGCHVLVTSRAALPGLVARNGARRLTLATLDPADSRALLVRLLGSERAAAESEAVDKLARLCGHLPLALRIAAANVLGSSGPPERRVEAFVERLRSGNRLAELAVPADADAMVRGAFDLSYAALPTAARELFRVLSVVPGGDVTAATAAALLDVPPDGGRRLVEQLAAAHLVEQPVPGRYAQPDLLRLYAAEQLAAGAGAEVPWERLLRYYLDVVDAASRLLHPEAVRLPRAATPSAGPPRFADQREAVAWVDAELPALQAAVLRCAERGPRQAAWLLADALGGYFQLRGAVLSWHTVASAALAAAEAAGDETAQAMANLAISAAFVRQDRYGDGIRHGERALGLAVAAGWADGEVGALRALGNLYRLVGRPDEAADHLERALAVADRADLPSRASIIANIAVVNHEQGRLGAAALHYTHALELLSPATGRAAQVRTDLGDVLNGLGRPDEAMHHLTAALAVHRELGDRGQVAYNLRCQAEVHRDAGRWVPAHDLADAAASIAREIDDQRMLAQAQETAATVHLAAQRYGQALSLFDTALVLATGMANRYAQAQILTGIAAAHLGRHDAAPALAAAEAALDIARRGRYLLLEGQALANAAWAELQLDRFEPALGNARAAVVAHEQSGYVRGQVLAARALDLAVTRSRVGS